MVPLVITPKKCYTPPPGVSGIAHVFSVDYPLVTNSPGLVTIDSAGKVFVKLCNTGPTSVSIPRNAALGLIELVPREQIFKVDEKSFISAILRNCSTPPPLIEQDKKFIFDNLNLTVPDWEVATYKQLIEKNHDVFSKNDLDIGLGNNFSHRIYMRNNDPV